MNIIGIDFSLTKPAACVWDDSQKTYHFIGWPREDHISPKRKEIYRDHGVIIAEREDEKNPFKESSAKMRQDINNSQFLASDMVYHLEEWLDDDTIISFEGFAFGSTGDAVLQLSGYKYILMDRLAKYVPLKNMYTYAPITLKKTAGCSKKGMGKKEMISSFLENEPQLGFVQSIKDNPDLFMKKGHKNYIELLDDLIDGYWALQTFKEKEL